MIKRTPHENCPPVWVEWIGQSKEWTHKCCIEHIMNCCVLHSCCCRDVDHYESGCSAPRAEEYHTTRRYEDKVCSRGIEYSSSVLSLIAVTCDEFNYTVKPDFNWDGVKSKKKKQDIWKLENQYLGNKSEWEVQRGECSPPLRNLKTHQMSSNILAFNVLNTRFSLVKTSQQRWLILNSWSDSRDKLITRYIKVTHIQQS